MMLSIATLTAVLFLTETASAGKETISSRFPTLDEHIRRLDNADLRRRLSTRPKHMLKKAEYHMAANKGPYEQVLIDDLKTWSLGDRQVRCNDVQGKALGKLSCSNMDA